MIIYEITETENHPIYRRMEAENGNRQYDFINSIVAASLDMGRPFLSQQVIRALNFHAIACLHIQAGEYRPCEVGVGAFRPPAFYRVQALMDDLVNYVNLHWDRSDALVIATYVLWRMNYIHPFINGNGRTARAAAYFTVCVKSGGILPGSITLPQLIRRDRVEYVQHLSHASQVFQASGQPDLAPLHGMMQRLMREQLASASAPFETVSSTAPSTTGSAQIQS